MSGVVAAWAVAQVGLGLYFALAYLVGRRTKSSSSSACSASASLFRASGSPSTTAAPDRELACARGAHHPRRDGSAGAINVHFAMEFAQVARRRRLAAWLYGLAALFGSSCSRAPSSTAHAPRGELGEGAGRPPAPSWRSFYVVGVLQSIAAITLLVRAYRRGRREALSALIESRCASPRSRTTSSSRSASWKGRPACCRTPS